MEQQSTKRGPGRPRTGRKARIDITVSPDVLAFLDWHVGRTGNVSGYIERLIKADAEYELWRAVARN